MRYVPLVLGGSMFGGGLTGLGLAYMNQTLWTDPGTSVLKLVFTIMLGIGAALIIWNVRLSRKYTGAPDNTYDWHIDMKDDEDGG